MKYVFHCLGLPHTVSNKEYVGCAYTQKVIKFAKMMKERGHFIYHYGHEDSDLVCDEHVTVITNKDLEIAYGNYDWKKNFFKFNTSDHAYKTFYKNAIEEIGKRKENHHFLLAFWGSGVRPICDAHQDMIVVEPGIGYAGGHWARWKIFESYAIYHAYYGLHAVSECKQDWYDVVIPNYFEVDDFQYCDKKEDYFLFIGRVYVGKGVHIAIQATEKLGIKLKIAGQGSLEDVGYKEIPEHVELLGYVGKEQRRELMAKAKAGFVCSMYVEPFGGVMIEFLLSGTPVISSDWGSLAENNIHGVTGYRCRTFEQFLWASKNIDKIKPINCRKWGLNFSCENIAPMYEEYFDMVMNVYTGNGWYHDNENRLNLDWLYKDMSLLDIPNKSLHSILHKYKSDKIPDFHINNHTYYKKYEELFEKIRHLPIKLFEMGLGSLNSKYQSNMLGYNQCYDYQSGSSLKAWKEYFYHEDTQIHGGDIDKEICRDKYGKNIFTYCVDQLDKEQLTKVFNKSNFYNIIIDDGLHTFEAAHSMLYNSWESLCKGGYYIIEDLVVNDIKEELKLNAEILKYVEVWKEPKAANDIQNNYLIIIQKLQNIPKSELFYN